jgi:hypothetical protein
MSKHSKASVVAHAKPVAVPEPVETLDTPFERGIHDAIDPDLRHRMISEAAYYHFQQGGDRSPDRESRSGVRVERSLKRDLRQCERVLQFTVRHWLPVPPRVRPRRRRRRDK